MAPSDKEIENFEDSMFTHICSKRHETCVKDCENVFVTHKLVRDTTKWFVGLAVGILMTFLFQVASYQKTMFEITTNQVLIRSNQEQLKRDVSKNDSTISDVKDTLKDISRSILSIKDALRIKDHDDNR